MELPQQVVIGEKCGLDLAPYPDLPLLDPPNDNEEDGSEFKVDAVANHKRGLVLHPEDGGTIVVSDDDDDALNEEKFGNASVVSIRHLNHETSLDNGDSGKVPFHGSIRENDAAAGESAETEFCFLNAKYEGADEAVKGKGLVENGIRDIDEAVKGECYPSENLENSETPFSSLQNLGLLGHTLVPVVESDGNSKSSIIVTGDCAFATDLSYSENSRACQGPGKDTVGVISSGEPKQPVEDYSSSIVDFAGVLESVAHDETVCCQRESECSSNSEDVGEIHVQSSDMASGSRNFVESNFISSHDDCCSTDVNDKWDECVEPSAAGASLVCKRCSEVDGSVEFHLLTVERDSEDEANAASEPMGSAELEVPEKKTLDADSDPCSNNESGSSIEKVIHTPENQQCDDMADIIDIKNVPKEVHEAKSTLCDMESADNLIVKEQKEGSFVHHGDGYSERYEEHASLLKGGEISFGTVDSIIKIRSVGQSPNAPASNGHAPDIEVEICQVEAVFNGSKPEIREMETVGISRLVSEASTEPKFEHNGFVQPSAFNPPTEKVKEDFPTIYESYPQARFAVNTDIDASIPSANSDLKLKPDIHFQNVTPSSNSGETEEVCILLCGNAELKLQEAEEKGDQVEDSTSPNWKPENIQANNVSDASPEDNTKNLDGGEARTDTKTKPFNFLVKIPRSDESSIREQIRLAKMHVDEKTKLRDAIQDHIQRRRVNSQVYATDYECAKVEARNARKLVRLKRIEIDSLNSVINKAKNAMSIEDIDIQIRKMENVIQHETLPLKEEKLLIRDIKQLKQLREQLSSSLGNQDEINQALEQREDVEQRLKALRKELDILKDGVLKAEEAAIEAWKKYETENSDIKELRSRFRDAHDIRQAAFVHLQNLRKELWKKNKLFFKYKDDATAASNYAFGGNTEALNRLCLDHVENFMDIWNTNEAFRNEYAECSAKSALRRFGSMDALTVCTDEKTVLLRSCADGRVDTIISKPINSDVRSVNSFSDSNEETSFTAVAPDGGTTSKVPEIQYQEVDGRLREDQHNEANHEVYEEPEITMSVEEVESLRKVEEQRMQEVEVELKEQRRLEELAKASVARERKKRQLEKLQMRAEMKTRKEAQQKEKEREKRLRKKERKKASISDTSDISSHCETSPSSDKAVMELTKEIENCPTPRKPQKPWLFSKNTKSKSAPPHLRNRNKKKWQQWMWVGATSLFVLVLFCLGNAIILSSVNLKRPSPGY